jgi:hypothetical protein
MLDKDVQINFDAPATLRKWPSVNNERVSACPCRKPYLAWQWIENRAMLLCNEGPLQAYWLDGCRSDPVASNARGRDLGTPAANKRSAADCSEETILPSAPSTD